MDSSEEHKFNEYDSNSEFHKNLIDPELLKNALDPKLLMGDSVEQEFFKGIRDSAIFNAISVPPELSTYMKEISNNLKSEKYSFFNDYMAMPIMENISLTEQREYYEESLRLLSAIKDNTANLNELIKIITENGDNQEIIISLLSKMLDIATAKNKAELDDKLNKVLNDIKNAMELGDLTGKLMFYAYTIFQMVSPHIIK